MDRQIIELYDDYTHRHLDRRLFLERLSQLVGGTAAAAVLLPLLEGSGAQAAMVAEDDARLVTRMESFPAASGTMNAYVVMPKGASKLPAVLVIHENRGLNPHIRDVTRRLALEGFVAMAPDGLSAQGGTPADADQAREMIRALDLQVTIKDYVAAVSYLKAHSNSTGKVGSVGFCWGGAMSNQMAVNAADLSAAVVYYGRSPRTEDVAKIKVPLLLHYASLDEPINKDVPRYEADLKKAGVKYTLHMYEGVHHAFNNDTSAARYDEAAAALAWQRTVSFLKTTLAD